MSRISPPGAVRLALVGTIVVMHTAASVRTVIRERKRREQIKALKDEYTEKFNQAKEAGLNYNDLNVLMDEFREKLEAI